MPGGTKTKWGKPLCFSVEAARADSMRGDSPRMDGTAPRMLGSALRILWSALRMLWSAPRMLWNSPRMTGNSPRMEGTTPRMEGTTPRMTESHPRMTESHPRITGNSPRMSDSRKVSIAAERPNVNSRGRQPTVSHAQRIQPRSGVTIRPGPVSAWSRRAAAPAPCSLQPWAFALSLIRKFCGAAARRGAAPLDCSNSLELSRAATCRRGGASLRGHGGPPGSAPPRSARPRSAAKSAFGKLQRVGAVQSGCAADFRTPRTSV